MCMQLHKQLAFKKEHSYGLAKYTIIDEIFANVVVLSTCSHELEMQFYPVSEKVSKALLGVTIESELIKTGSPE